MQLSARRSVIPRPRATGFAAGGFDLRWARSAAALADALWHWGLWGQPAPGLLLTAKAIFTPSCPCPTWSGDEQCIFLMLFLHANQGLLLAWQMQCIGLPGAHIPACLRVSACAFLPARSESGEEVSGRGETSRSTVSQDKGNLLLSLQRLSLSSR